MKLVLDSDNIDDVNLIIDRSACFCWKYTVYEWSTCWIQLPLEYKYNNV